MRTPEPRLPPGFRSFRELHLCSNVLVDVPVPLSVGEQPALLVGHGLSLLKPVLRVWLAAPASPDRKEWMFVVESNRPLRPLIEVAADKETGAVEVRVGGLLPTLVLRVKQTAADTAVIDALDLRPLGLLVYGNDRELHLGGMTMERNRFGNLDVAFAIEGQQAGGETPRAGEGR